MTFPTLNTPARFRIGAWLAQQRYTLLDAVALLWIFSATLSFGLMWLEVNRFSLMSVGFSVLAATTWWLLSHARRSAR